MLLSELRLFWLMVLSIFNFFIMDMFKLQDTSFQYQLVKDNKLHWSLVADTHDMIFNIQPVSSVVVRRFSGSWQQAIPRCIQLRHCSLELSGRPQSEFICRGRWIFYKCTKYGNCLAVSLDRILCVCTFMTGIDIREHVQHAVGLQVGFASGFAICTDFLMNITVTHISSSHLPFSTRMVRMVTAGFRVGLKLSSAPQRSILTPQVLEVERRCGPVLHAISAKEDRISLIMFVCNVLLLGSPVVKHSEWFVPHTCILQCVTLLVDLLHYAPLQCLLQALHTWRWYRYVLWLAFISVPINAVYEDMTFKLVAALDLMFHSFVV